MSNGRLRSALADRLPGAARVFRAVRVAVADRLRTVATTFAEIHRRRSWGDVGSVSGPGSTLAATLPIRRALPGLLKRLGVRTLLDVPCGDFAWMREVRLEGIRYIGGDIVPALVEENRRCFAAPGREFLVVDLTTGPLPAADLVLCRDCFIHLSYRRIHAALRQMRRSGARWLLTTTNPAVRANHDIATGSYNYRPINLEVPPFGFPRPLWSVREGPISDPVSGGPLHERGDYLGLWRIADIPQER